jgi:hypothetical protein
LTNYGVLGLLVQIPDLPLQIVGTSQQRLVEFCCDIDRRAGGLKVLRGLPAEAYIYR